MYKVTIVVEGSDAIRFPRECDMSDYDDLDEVLAAVRSGLSSPMNGFTRVGDIDAHASGIMHRIKAHFEDVDGVRITTQIAVGGLNPIEHALIRHILLQM